MAEARQIEPDLVGIQSTQEDFFGTSYFDGRFTSSDYHMFPPIHDITVDPLSFVLPAMKSGSVYRMNQAVLSISVKIMQRDGQPPAKDSLVALANNSLNSLFKDSDLTLNGVSVNSSPEYHYLRSSIYLLPNSSRIHDMCPLEAMGYFYAQGVTRDMKQDNSFVKRKEFFLKEGTTNEYSGLAATFVGQIHHDLLTCETGKENSMVKTKVSKLKKFWAKYTKKI